MSVISSTGLMFGDGRDGHFGDLGFGRADRNRGEDDAARLVGFAVAGDSAVDVGNVAGDHVQALGLRGQGTAGDVEDTVE